MPLQHYTQRNPVYDEGDSDQELSEKVSILTTVLAEHTYTVIREIFVSKMLVPATPYRSNMHTLYTAMKIFVHLISYTTAHTKIF